MTIYDFSDLPQILPFPSVWMTFLSCGTLNACVRLYPKQDCWCMMINSAMICCDSHPPHPGKGRLATVVMGNIGMFSLIQWLQDIFGLLMEVQVYALETRISSQTHTSDNLSCTCVRFNRYYSICPFDRIKTAILKLSRLPHRRWERVSISFLLQGNSLVSFPSPLNIRNINFKMVFKLWSLV